MNNQEIETQLKHVIKQKVLDSGQSEEYFEKLWSLWWGWMDTDFQNGIFEFINSISSEEKHENRLCMARANSPNEPCFHPYCKCNKF